MRKRIAIISSIAAVGLVGGLMVAQAATLAKMGTLTMSPGTSLTVKCPNALSTANRTTNSIDLQCASNPPPPTTTTTTTPPTTTTTTTVPPTTTTTTTTPPPTTTVTGGPANWPTQANTGSSGTLTDYTPPTGELILDQPNTTFANTRVHGVVTVTACNVTLHNDEIDATEPYTGNTTPDMFAIWLKEDPSCGATIDHVSVLTNSSGYATEAARDAYGGPATYTFDKFIGQQLGVSVGSGTSISDSYMLLASNLRGDHNEDLIDDGIVGLTLTHNTFLNPNGQTSALSLFNEFGPNSNFTIRDNLMAVINNVFWRLYYPDSGAYAAGLSYNPAGGGQWTGNVYMNQDGTLTTQLVPQPALAQ